jgi:hypothetical protein
LNTEHLFILMVLAFSGGTIKLGRQRPPAHVSFLLQWHCCAAVACDVNVRLDTKEIRAAAMIWIFICILPKKSPSLKVTISIRSTQGFEFSSSSTGWIGRSPFLGATEKRTYPAQP